VNFLGRKEWGSFSSWILRVAFLVHTAFIVTRGINVMRVPFVGPFEFGNLFIWSTALVYVWSEWRLKDRYYAVGAFLTPLIVAYVAYISLFPKIDRVHKTLHPLLDSFWLKFHVSASVLGYAGISLAFAAALMWIAKNMLEKNKIGLSKALPQPKILEEYMYRAAVFGFLFQTVMIITGSIWADASWGRYWGWDPKEMWSLITWFVFAVYLHARFTRGWHGSQTIFLVIVGWIAMVFTWAGVAWVLTGLHSFG
jgi:cytochrome c-type biogenesis protein CcsB